MSKRLLPNIFFCFFTSVCVLGLQAQLQVNKPIATAVQTPDVTVNKAPATLPDAYSATVKTNYVRTQEAMKGGITDERVFNAADYRQVRQTTQYLDGLGRPLQTVARQSSPGTNPMDIVAPVVYDGFGREVNKYLPYVTTPDNTETGSVNDGNLKLTPFSSQQAFYQSTYKDASGNLMYRGEKFLYSETQYEPSPLNRVTTMMAPGNSWTGNNTGVVQQYLINTQDDSVRIWNIPSTQLDYASTTQNAGTNIPVSGSAYEPGSLYKNVLVDEAGNAVVEYKDKEGKVILKKVQAGAVAADYSGWLCTYYVYDDLNQLRFVLPPKAVESLVTAGSWDLSSNTTLINELCFRYEYDHRQRMIAKKVPGSGWMYMVYDVRDRLVFSQDANMKTRNQWMTTLYDVLNRPVTTGMLSYSLGWQSLQAYVNADTSSLPSTMQVSGISSPAGMGIMPVDLRTPGQTLYEASQKISFENGFVTELGAEFVARINATQVGTGTTSQDIEVVLNPLPAGSNFVALTITHYDNYDQMTDKSYKDDYNSKLDYLDVHVYPEVMPSASGQQSAGTAGLVTWSKVRVLENPEDLSTGAWLSSVTFYDDKGRPLQTQSDNYKQGTDIVTSHYDFTGKVLSSYLSHSNPEATPGSVRVKTELYYDYGGRLLETWKTINDQEGKRALLAKNEYDELGQLKTKQLGRKRNNDLTYSSEALETLDYNYNIRGWLKGINAAYSHPELASSSPDRWFGMELNYDWGSGINQYNGNISSATWKSRGDGVRRAYGFSYDKTNRLLGADFSEYNGGAYMDNSAINFDMVMGDGTSASSAYDANGNIRAMKQWGVKLTGSAVIDDLVYTYGNQITNKSNKLLNVIDKNNDASTTLGDFRTSNSHAQHFTKEQYVNDPNSLNPNTITDYTYDGNGNLNIDRNKDISAIAYNHLNLSYKVTMNKDDAAKSEKGTITYIYDAAGNKLEKRVHDNSGSAATDRVTTYIGGMVYEEKVLQFISHEEGRTRMKQTGTDITYNNDFFIKDHLGNVRMVLTDEKENVMYPAATLEAASLSDEKLLYNIPDSAAVLVNKNTVPGYPNDTYTSPNDYIHKLNGSGTKIGSSIVLKVMAGDMVGIRASSWYRLNGPTGGSSNPVADIIMSFAGGIERATASKITQQQIAQTGVLSPGVGDFLTQRSTLPGGGNSVKAFVSYILLDEQFKVVMTNDGKNSGFDPVGGDQEFKQHIIEGREMTKNGYLYIYVSNETENLNVFFDNLQVTHKKGPLLEETHYYPFGLTMQGISSKAAGGIENKFKYGDKELQNKEFSDGSGLEWYDYGARMYDAQIGRWHKIDNKAELYQNLTPYAYAGNQPTNAIDPDGNVIIFINGLADESDQGKSSYWRYTTTSRTTYNNVTHRTGAPHNRTVTHAFDKDVMKQLRDGNARYYDGSVGGSSSWGSEPDMIFSGEPGSLSSSFRDNAGHQKGEEVAADIIASLKRTGGVISETIKIITHSMGGAYGKGFVRALKEYIKTLPIALQKQIQITLVADFDPYQAGEITADPDIKTKQIKHANTLNIKGMGFLANEDEKGLNQSDITTNTGTSTDHAISTFFNDITNLAEGTYKWDDVNKKFVKQ